MRSRNVRKPPRKEGPLTEHFIEQPRYPSHPRTGGFASQHYCWFAFVRMNGCNVLCGGPCGPRAREHHNYMQQSGADATCAGSGSISSLYPLSSQHTGRDTPCLYGVSLVQRATACHQVTPAPPPARAHQGRRLLPTEAWDVSPLWDLMSGLACLA
jgi:hypothetical protein